MEEDKPFVACSKCMHHFSIEKIGGKYMTVKCPSCGEKLYVTAIFIANSNPSFINYLVTHVQEVAIPLACDLLRTIKNNS